MQNKLQIEINAPSIEEYHDVLHYVTQRIDTGFTGGSGIDREFFARPDIKLEWSIELVSDLD